MPRPKRTNDQQIIEPAEGSEDEFVGTFRQNLLTDAVKKLKSEKKLKAEGRGSYSIVTSSDNISLVRWYDNKPVHAMSSFVGIGETEIVNRFDRKNKKIVRVKRPEIISTYNKCMGGVDLMDSLVALYRNYPQNRRWYMRIFFHFLNVCIVNAWIMSKQKK